MNESENNLQYLTYLLRLWPVRVGETTVWRACLESSQMGDRIGFSDLEALFEYLEHSLQNIFIDEDTQKERDNE